MRKAQFGFGWDWGPRLPTVGIWRPIELRRERRASIRGAHFYTLDIDPTGKRAAVAERVEVERFATEDRLEAAITLTSPNGSLAAKYSLVLDGEDSNFTAYLTVENSRRTLTPGPYTGECFLPPLRPGHGEVHKRVWDARRARTRDPAAPYHRTSSIITAPPWTTTTRTLRRDPSAVDSRFRGNDDTYHLT